MTENWKPDFKKWNLNSNKIYKQTILWNKSSVFFLCKETQSSLFMNKKLQKRCFNLFTNIHISLLGNTWSIIFCSVKSCTLVSFLVLFFLMPLISPTSCAENYTLVSTHIEKLEENINKWCLTLWDVMNLYCAFTEDRYTPPLQFSVRTCARSIVSIYFHSFPSWPMNTSLQLEITICRMISRNGNKSSCKFIPTVIYLHRRYGKWKWVSQLQWVLSSTVISWL